MAFAPPCSLPLLTLPEPAAARALLTGNPRYLALAEKGIAELVALQQQALAG